MHLSLPDTRCSVTHHGRLSENNLGIQRPVPYRGSVPAVPVRQALSLEYKMKSRYFCFLFIVLASIPVFGEQRVVEIELQDFVFELIEPVGKMNYQGSGTYSISEIPTSIDNVSIRFVGVASMETICCPEQGCWPWWLSAYLDDLDLGVIWRASELAMNDGPFDITGDFQCGESSSFEFLRGGSGEIRLWAAPNVVSFPVPCPYPSGNLEQAFLVISGDFLVPTTANSWGVVKSLYR